MHLKNLRKLRKLQGFETCEPDTEDRSRLALRDLEYLNLETPGGGERGDEEG